MNTAHDVESFYFGTNVKMHQTPTESQHFVQMLNDSLPNETDTQCFAFLPYTSLPQFSERRHSCLWLGAQNAHWADEGNFTGEISPVMLKSINVDFILLGHAERRHLFGETNIAIQKKVAAAQTHGMRILLCVGEAAAEKQNCITSEILSTQLKVGLNALNPDYAGNLLIAYEPVWSIGESGTPITVDELRGSLQHIRNVLEFVFGEKGTHIPILYGGSVNLDNCTEYAVLPEVNGLFVGRAARAADDFIHVLRKALHARQHQVNATI